MCPDHEYSAIADEAGNISNADFVTEEHDIGVTFTVTAIGLGSGLTAEATFTDACASGQVRDETCPLTDLPNCTVGCRWIAGQFAGRCSTLSAPVVRGTLCREATDLCDKADTCDGSHQFCPADAVLNAGAACRGPNGPCDFVERCDGISKECPPDGFLGEERTCRPSAGSCDTAEICSGTSAQCPEDAFLGQEKTCRPASGDCDAPDKCSGSSPDCPSDAVKPEGTTCRAVNGPCDKVETCSGASKDCPSNGFVQPGTTCRSVAGPCDKAETCSGSSAQCPTDDFLPTSTKCRTAVGPCDLDDYCTHTGPTCPDSVKEIGTSCTSDVNPCTAEICDGSSTACQKSTGACSLITSSSLCTYDVDTSIVGSQFRLIYTSDVPAFKLNASNPGQFFYNVIYIGGGNTTLSINVPYPFVTQGNTPIHVYSNVTTTASNGAVCFIPGTEIANSQTKVTLANYSPQQFGSTVAVGVSIPGPLPNNLAYINIHLDYGFKGTTNYAKDANNNAIDATTLAMRIPHLQSYAFSDSDGGSDTTANVNVFKKNPGIGGLTIKSASSDPIANEKVQVYDSSNKLKATVYTDADGWYMWPYKYSGKAATFTIKLPNRNLAQSVTLKSNGFAGANFTVP